MNKKKDIRVQPFDLSISFKKLFDFYEKQLSKDDDHLRSEAKKILKIAKDYPILSKGFKDVKSMEPYRPQIDIILKDIFSKPLTDNEIKMATVPFQNLRFYSSRRLRKILKHAGPDFNLTINSMTEDEFYVVACTVILRAVYGFNIKHRRPFIYEIPDENGVKRHYKILYNADFTEIKKTKRSPGISEQDFNELIDNFTDIELWKKKFPPKSYGFNGFVIANLVDVTTDQSISNIKTALIEDNKRQTKSFMKNFKSVFQSLLEIHDLEVGFSTYNKELQTFDRVYGEGIVSYLLSGKESDQCKNALCDQSYDTIVNKQKLFSISDVDRYYKLSNGKSPQYKTLKEQGVKSAILAPIASKNELLGILELVSTTPKILNSVTAERLHDVMPFIVSSVLRSKREQENLVIAVIQRECTSIHSSVHWKFERAALKFIQEGYKTDGLIQFDEIVMKDVYPLFGQIDVKGSSDARNQAMQKDLAMQLNLLSKIFENVLQKENLPFYEQMAFQVKTYHDEVNTDFKVDSEQQIYNFVKKDVNPVLQFIAGKHPGLALEINDYFEKIDDVVDLIYFYRKSYDDTVMLINKNMSALLDEKQKEAQHQFPHYFERFKTDGVEHNMYIGQSISKTKKFDKVYLYNLRLWQLQVMCEMENDYYQNQHQYPLALDVSSMILVFNQPLSVRFRMDEKRFDVDGTYNARYEVVKKRVDKANIKGTDERITTKGKLAIIYSQKEDEREYLRYIKFLQSKNTLKDDLEILDIEDLQGVSGLKAIRVGIVYSEQSNPEMYTYNDLVKTLNN